ncbi:hypothetical protein [Corallococcus sp. Z5C101001]|nr:hypothetical protein [Corallococcus sp. Z5C101001]
MDRLGLLMGEGRESRNPQSRILLCWQSGTSESISGDSPTDLVGLG